MFHPLRPGALFPTARIVFLLVALTLSQSRRKTFSPGCTPNGEDEPEPLAVTNIFGGWTSPLGRFPYLCHMTYSANPGSGTCAGILIAPQWVLTAAHCVDDSQGEREIHEILCGIHRLAEPRSKNVFGALEVHVYELFDPPVSRLRYDIALIKLDREAEFTVPILSLKEDPEEGDTAYIAGWGEYDDTGKLSKHLRVAQLKVVDTPDCRHTWHKRYDTLVIEEDRLCAGVTQGRTCYGDSGGPLIIAHSPKGHYSNGDPAEDVIVGISSFGVCTGKYPAVFTRVSHFFDWIEETINEGAITAAPPSMSSYP